MLASIVAIVAYVLGALGFYTIAKRRGINHAWLAWVPIGNLWLLGCISDQYQSIARGKVKNKRKALLGLGIVQAVCVVIILVVCISVIVQLVVSGAFLPEEMPGSEIYEGDIYIDEFYGDMYDVYSPELPAELMAEMSGFVVAMVGAAIVLSLVSVVMLVLEYIAMYDVFASCDPDNAVLFLLLSIFLNISPFLVFANREKDRGMPRPSATVYTEYQSYAQPPVPPAEPWEQKEE